MAAPRIRKGVRWLLDARAAHRGDVPGSPPDRVRRILVIRFDQIGDAVLTLPLIGGLRGAYAGAAIDWIVRPVLRPLLAPLAGAGVRIVPFDVPWWRGEACGGVGYAAAFLRFLMRFGGARYDVAVAPRPADWRETLCLVLARARWRAGHDCAGLGAFLSARLRAMPGAHAAEESAQALSALGIDRPSRGIPLPVSARARSRVRALLGERGAAGRYAVMAPGAGYPSKLWPIERFAEVARGLAREARLATVAVGSGAERARTAELVRASGSRAIDLGGSLDLGELAALIEGAALFVGCDSGPAHIAGVLGRPALVVFSGSNEGRRWRPLGARVRVIEKAVACKPCHRKVCPLPAHVCMEAIGPEEVLEAARELLAGERAMAFAGPGRV